MVECRYYGACRYASGNCSNGGDDAPDCEDFVPMPDVDALRRLADELDSPGYGWVSNMRRGIARRIREAVNACEARPDAPVAVDDEQTDTDAYMDDSEAAEGYHIVDVSDKFNENIAAIDFVRDNGGLEAVKARLMPEGMEWPRFEDGELVQLGDKFECRCGEEHVVGSVSLRGRCAVLNMSHAHTFVVGNSPETVHGKRVKRPKVRAADGEPLEVGQTVYATHYDYAKCTVLAIEWAVDGYLVEVENEDGHKFRQTPDEFTHQRHVLDADGVEIREVDTVWDEHGDELVVLDVYGQDVHCRYSEYEDQICDNGIWDPSQLTHERPDSWEHIEEDAGKDCCVYYGNVPWTSCNRCPAKGVEDCNATMARDLVRRAKKLAGDA